MAGETDHQIEAGDQHPIDRRAGADQRPIVVADERQQHRECEYADQRRYLRPCAARGGRHFCRRGGERCHHTLRAVAEPNRPCGAASSTMMNRVNTATEENTPPTRKLAACWNRPSPVS